MTTLCHSVRSCRSPSRVQVSDVARLNFTTLPPLEKLRDSGSRPRLPIRITLLTLPAITTLLSLKSRYKPSVTAVQWPHARAMPYRLGGRHLPPVPGEADDERNQDGDLRRDHLARRE